MLAVKWGRYLLYSLIILAVLVIRGYFSNRMNYFENPDLVVTVSLIFNIIIGIVIGLEVLLKELRKKGPLKLNIPKLIFMGVPSLFFSLSYFIFYKLYFIPYIVKTVEFMLIRSTSNLTLIQIIFGYIVSTSLYKDERIDFENNLNINQ
jgi:hypothetical protein